MSTYQYYEFRAVDRPLTSAEQGALRKLSTRADITSTRFVNVYNYGDFGGDPDRLMERYFDAFVYLSSWGSRELQLRLPRGLFDPALARPYLREDVLSVRTTSEHVILKFHVAEEDEGGWTEGEGWLDSLLPVRELLLSGDLRALYIGWLAGGAWDEEDGSDGQPEPPVPPGLRESSKPLRALADFFFVPRSLLTAAAKANPAPASSAVPKQALAQWLAGYESWVQQVVGLEWRHACLAARRKPSPVPAEALPVEWRRLAARVASLETVLNRGPHVVTTPSC